MTDEEYEQARRGWIAWYGEPAYGGWTRDPADGRQKPRAVIEDPEGDRRQREDEADRIY